MFIMSTFRHNEKRQIRVLIKLVDSNYGTKNVKNKRNKKNKILNVVNVENEGVGTEGDEVLKEHDDGQTENSGTIAGEERGEDVCKESENVMMSDYGDKIEGNVSVDMLSDESVDKGLGSMNSDGVALDGEPSVKMTAM
nr:hypothetical protein [Tanacetum cinerariifolium]